MASINIDDEKRLIVSIKDISSLDTSIGENQTVTADTSDINYIPGYVASEEERRANEIQRVENENEREAYYEEIQKKVANGEFKGEKGNKGEKGEDGLTTAISVNGSTYTHDNGLITLPDYPIVPTNVSQLNNDSNFISDSNYVHTDNNYTSEEKEKVAVIDKSGNGTKYLSDDGTYKTVSSVGGTSDYNDLENKPSINNIELVGNKTLNELGFEVPTKTSDLENNSGFITNADIPSNISSFNNDSGYITSIPDEYITETELTSKGYLTSIPDTYKTKTENDALYQPKGTYLTEEQDPTVPSYVKTITEQNITDWNNKSDFSGSYNDLTNLPVLNEIKKIMPDIYTASNPFIFHGIEAGIYQIVAGAYYKYNTDDGYRENDSDMYLMCVKSRSDMCGFYLFSDDILSISTYSTGGYGYSSKTPSITNIRLNGYDLTPVNGTVAIKTPTKTSELTNDSGYLTSYIETDPIYIADKPNIALKSELFSKDYNDLTNVPSIPTKVSELENDSNFINSYTETDPLYMADKPDIAFKNEIPANTSDLYNDSNYVSDANYVHTDNNYTTEDMTILKKISNYIIESGSNANGYYEKYASGTLKQWGKVTVTAELKKAHGSSGWFRTANEQFITHPVPFVGEKPVVNLTPQAALNIAYVSTNNLDNTGFYPLVPVSSAGATRYVHWQAIGRWK